MGPFDDFREYGNGGSDDNDGPEEDGLVPPSQDEAVKRALCIGALVLRCEIEQVAAASSGEDDGQAEAAKVASAVNEGLADKLKFWMDAESLEYSQTREERRLFELPVGGWSARDVIDASWRIEALCAVMWALSLVRAMPPYDEMVGHGALTKKLELMGHAEDFAMKARLRDMAEITKARDTAELWHWRANTTRCIAEGICPPEGVTYEQIIKGVAQAAHESGDIPKPVDDDFPAFGKAYRKLSFEEFSTTMSIARERHFGLNWLCGYSGDWDETPTDT